jgi:hypothetical protein
MAALSTHRSLGCSPGSSGETPLAEVSIHQVGQRRKDAGRVAGGLRGNLLEL